MRQMQSAPAVNRTRRVDIMSPARGAARPCCNKHFFEVGVEAPISAIGISNCDTYSCIITCA